MTRRGLMAVFVLAAWGVGLGALVSRELNPSFASELADAALRVVPATTWFTVERDGRQVGFASVQFDTIPGSLEVSEYVVTDDSSDSGRVRMTERKVAVFSRGLRMRNYAWRRVTGSDTTVATVRVIDTTRLALRLPGGEERTVNSGGPFFPGVSGPAVAMLLQEPAVGVKRSLRTIDPLTGTTEDIAIGLAAESLFVVVDSAVANAAGRWYAVHRDTVRAWHAVSADGMGMDLWMDSQGQIVEARRNDGLTLRRTAFEIAFENWRQNDPARAVPALADGRIVGATWLASGAPPPRTALESITVQVGGGYSREVADWFQLRRRQTTRTIARATPEQWRSRYALPANVSWQESFRSSLQSTPELDAEAPGIARRAIRLRGRETDPAIVAERIVHWAHDSLRAEVPGTPRSASETVAAGGGDAREFALVVTALARAAGIPARTETGLLFHGGRFHVHSWSVVYLGRWIPVDGMLGQFPADAAHIGIVQEAVDLGPEITRILARLDLSVTRSVPVRP